MSKNHDRITERANCLIEKHQTRNPFDIAVSLGIQIIYSDELNRLKGLYRVIKRNRFIILNGKNPASINTIVMAHEIGHDQFHRSFAGNNTLKEFMIYDMSMKQEYEANIFAAELLIEDAEIIDCVNQGFDLFQTARALGSDTNLIALKLDIMNKKGFNLRNQERNTTFLK